MTFNFRKDILTAASIIVLAGATPALASVDMTGIGSDLGLTTSRMSGSTQGLTTSNLNTGGSTTNRSTTQPNRRRVRRCRGLHA